MLRRMVILFEPKQTFFFNQFQRTRSLKLFDFHKFINNITKLHVFGRGTENNFFFSVLLFESESILFKVVIIS